jgi:hypothetical protein
MAKYGNIMTLYNYNDAQVAQVKTVLDANGVKFAIKENIFFIETTSKPNTGKLVQEITQLNVKFIFFHNNNSDGSRVESEGIEPEFLKNVNEILFL